MPINIKNYEKIIIHLKLQSVTFFLVKNDPKSIFEQYIISQCSKLSPYFSLIHKGYNNVF